MTVLVLGIAVLLTDALLLVAGYLLWRVLKADKPEALRVVTLPAPARQVTETESAAKLVLEGTTARAAIVVLIHADTFSTQSAIHNGRFPTMVEQLSTHAILRGLHGDMLSLVRSHLDPDAEED